VYSPFFLLIVSLFFFADDDGDAQVLYAGGGLTLAPNETLAVCSGHGCVGEPGRSLRLTERNVWGNQGDAAFLYDADGREVARHAY
jgi:hypothetical protein